MSARRRLRRLVLLWALVIAIAGVLGPGASAGPRPSAPPSRLVDFKVRSLFPSFSPRIHNYVVRCDDSPTRVMGHALGRWRAAIGRHRFRHHLSRAVRLRAGRAFTITVKRHKRARRHPYHVRCLPNDFPNFTFTRSGPVSPKFFSVDQFRAWRYAIIFNHHGVPVWWYHAPVHDTRVLADGRVLWADHRQDPARWEIHRLDGTLARVLHGVSHPINHHDIQLLGNGDYLIGSNVKQDHVDTSAYGGSSDATVINTELQQVSSDRRVVWEWQSQDHISLAETGRFWPWAINHGYDIQHWNSIEPAGKSVIASFRHLDAVYKIRKSTGEIVWKLGGTSTPQSLEVMNESRNRTFGAQHDARLLDDGTLTVFDNRTSLRHNLPRAARYRIDQRTGTATLLQSIIDPDVPVSYCCGSARRFGNGGWLISWGKPGPIGGYERDGDRTFLLRFDSGYVYRAEPVPAGALSARDLRKGMRAMASGAG